ncbi:MAG: hypothetical protein U5K55_02185 [Aliarcobacter sp.]|nr:hypothetical protein [Aliarcobacter sp.]
MKKDLSLITALLLSAPLLADNLSDAFTNGKIKGEIKSVYSNSNFLGKSKSDDITTIGGNLNYITGDFYGFNAGSTVQVSHLISEDNNNNIFKDDLDSSGAVLSEAYLEYNFLNTNAKAGRQFIYTPLVSTAIDGKSSERLIKDSFEAYLLTNTDIPNTTIVAGYVDKYQARANGSDLKFEQYEDGAYTFYVKNTSIENLELQVQYLKINKITSNNDIQDSYIQADYKIGNQTISAQYLGTNNESTKDGELFGIKATGPLGISNLGYLVAFNSSTKDADVNLGAGAGTTDTAFTAMPVNGGGVPSRANTDTLVGGIVIPILDVTTVAYAGNSWSNGGLGDVSAMGAMAIYPFYKNLLLKANYEHVETEHTIVPAGIVEGNTDVTRVYLSYKF